MAGAISYAPSGGAALSTLAARDVRRQSFRFSLIRTSTSHQYAPVVLQLRTDRGC